MTEVELADIMHVLNMARRWALTITPNAADVKALALHLQAIDVARAKLQAEIDRSVEVRP